MNFIPNRYYRWNTIEYTIQLLSNARIKLKLDCLKRAFSNRNQSNDTQHTSWLESTRVTLPNVRLDLKTRILKGEFKPKTRIESMILITKFLHLSRDFKRLELQEIFYTAISEASEARAAYDCQKMKKKLCKSISSGSDLESKFWFQNSNVNRLPVSPSKEIRDLEFLFLEKKPNLPSA